MNDYSVKKDSDLVEMTLCGHQKAFEELVMRHENAVKGTAYKVTGNVYSAKDASQDAFVSAWMKLDSLRDRDKFRSWVCAIAKNHAHHLSAHYHAATPDISLHLLENLDLSGSGEDELLGRLSAAKAAEIERDERLHEAVETLSEKIREAIRLHYFEGYSVKDIAEKLSLPEGTVKWRLCEGRRQLRKEYGVMETTYNDNEALVRRVMRQVEELKLWRLKNDKTGFETEYRAVLAAVESLDESTEKQYMLADVLMYGIWWIDDEKSEAILARIKDSAEKGKNEEVMTCVLSREYDGLPQKEALIKIRDEQIPYLETLGFTKALGYAHFWLAWHYLRDHDQDKALATFRRVLDILTPADTYCANALSAIALMKRYRDAAVENERFIEYAASAEVIKTVNGKSYFWAQPGFSISNGMGRNSSLLFNSAMCDSLLFDPTMKVGDHVISSDETVTLTMAKEGVAVTTPAGTFENCRIFTVEGATVNFLSGVENVFCEGVGLVKQTSNGDQGEFTWELTDFKANGDGWLPLAAGNYWEYATSSNDGVIYDVTNRFEVVYADEDTANLSGLQFVHMTGFEDDSWHGQMQKARQTYAIDYPDGREALDPTALAALERAEALAKTPREKRHTAIAKQVMKRIMDGDPTVNPSYTEFGCWNFFTAHTIAKHDEEIRFSGKFTRDGYAWKQLSQLKELSFDGWKILYNFLYDMLGNFAECVWSEAWVPGFHSDKQSGGGLYGQKYRVVLDVLDDETVETASGVFENCRHVVIDVTPDGNYRTGKKEYWFAPNVGIVKMFAYNPDGETEHCTWELTAFDGTGDGYFPVADGLFRRYEPVVLGDGYHAWVEYTFDVEGDSVIVFRNACGTRDRAKHEADNA